MFETLAAHIDALAALAPEWKFLLVFFFMAVESSFIPFPSEVVMIPAGFLAARGELGSFPSSAALALAVAVGVAGSLLGAYVNYFLALEVGKPFLEKYGKYILVKPEALARSCEIFNRYGAATTFVCRLVPGVRQLISIPAGLSRMSLGAFTLFTALGSGVWTAVLAVVGYGLGKTAGDISYYELCMRGRKLAAENLPMTIGGAIALVGLYVAVSRLVMRRR